MDKASYKTGDRISISVNSTSSPSNQDDEYFVTISLDGVSQKVAQQSIGKWFSITSPLGSLGSHSLVVSVFLQSKREVAKLNYAISAEARAIGLLETQLENEIDPAKTQEIRSEINQMRSNIVELEGRIEGLKRKVGNDVQARTFVN